MSQLNRATTKGLIAIDLGRIIDIRELSDRRGRAGIRLCLHVRGLVGNGRPVRAQADALHLHANGENPYPLRLIRPAAAPLSAMARLGEHNSAIAVRPIDTGDVST
jgi:hypothetical protein